MKNVISLFIAGVLLAGTGGTIYAIVGRSGAKPDTSPTHPAAYAWKNVVIRGGGFVSGIITHPKERGLMYARTDVGGAYRWDERAKRWVCLTDRFGGPEWNYTGIESLAVDPMNAKKVYIAAGTYTNDWAGNGAILRSSDRGDTWRVTPLPFKNGGNEDGRSAGERLAVDPNQPANLLFGSRNNGLLRSLDSGVTWNPVASFPVKGKTNGIGTVFLLFDASTGKPGAGTKTIYAGVSDKTTALYRSADGGATWNAVPGQPKGFLPHHGILSADGSLYVTYGNAPGPNGITDGAVWKMSRKTGAWSDVTPLKPGGGDNFGYAGVSVDAKSPGTLVVTTMDRWARHDTIFRTTNGGKSWNDIGPLSERDASLAPFLKWGRQTPDVGHWMGDIEIDPFNPDRVLYDTGMGIWTSSDITNADRGLPTHWHVGTEGLEETVPNNVVSPASGAPLLSAIGDIDGFRHTDLSVSPTTGFFQPAHGSNSDIDFAEKDPNIVARVYDGATGGAFSRDNGITWTEFVAKPAAKGAGLISVSADGAAFVWTPDGNAGSFVTMDRGTTWKACAGLPTTARRVVSDRDAPNRFYAASGGTVYVSEDGGNSFAARATSLLGGGDYLRAVPGQVGDLWYCAEDGGLYHSTDAGGSFARVPGVAGAHRIGFGKPVPGSAYPAVFVAGSIGPTFGFFRSDDAGATWVRINDDRHSFHYINSIIGDPRVYGRVYLATGGRGIIVGDVVAR